MTITNNKQHHNYIIVLCFVSIKKERIFYPLFLDNFGKNNFKTHFKSW